MTMIPQFGLKRGDLFHEAILIEPGLVDSSDEENPNGGYVELPLRALARGVSNDAVDLRAVPWKSRQRAACEP